MLLDEIRLSLIKNAVVNLNMILDLEPFIDTRLSREELCLKIKEAYPLVVPTDKLQLMTREILMLAKNYEAPKDRDKPRKRPGRPKKIRN